ncbi:MAG: hypothetical protein ACYC1Z_03495 [Georgenia sp.]
MTDLVPSEQIEQIVGVARHRAAHYGRAVAAEQTVYILHSQRCRDSGIDLRECRFSRALDHGIREEAWEKALDVPVPLGVWRGRLVPLLGVDGGEES